MLSAQAPATKRIILGVANFDLDLELMRESPSFCRITDNNNWLAQSISDFNGLHTESESICTWELCQKNYLSSDPPVLRANKTKKNKNLKV